MKKFFFIFCLLYHFSKKINSYKKILDQYSFLLIYWIMFSKY